MLLPLALAAAAAGQPPFPPKPAVAAALADLRPNHAVLLGKADVVGDFNDTARKYDLHKTGPRGRDFTNKMCWAPDRKRALFCGANHAVPHRLNDVWEFDLPSLTWSMLYAPDLPRGYTDLGKDTSDVEFKDGVLVTKRGGPAVIAHTWWGLTYDPRRRELLFMNTWVTDQKKAVRDLGGDPAALYAGPPLWAFNPAARTWRPFRSPRPYPVPIFGGMLEYVPELGGSVWHANNWQTRGSWVHDFEKDTWTDLKANGGGKAFEAEAPEPEQVGYYDPGRKLLVVHRHHTTHHYDVKANAWRKVLAGDKDDGKTPYGHDARAVFYHDPASGHGLLVQFQTNTVWAYDPDRVTWTKLTPQGDPMPTGGKRLGYVDPVLNALVVIDGTTVWAYRYR
ncbi:Kelch repeat-containing protein [Urbifossiella limnaea]|uniref:Uncharacterized protein n=1 Tax=Urbifossiella limnaea TaxID=2528023 RepID=A0A517XQB8_9BACT|nr:hypothetical protein [Urbifossiella limnaea]QDU19694.1 hypothetical protein ETAA1_16250 [Urbifossiella limnaea]